MKCRVFQLCHMGLYGNDSTNTEDTPMLSPLRVSVKDLNRLADTSGNVYACTNTVNIPVFSHSGNIRGYFLLFHSHNRIQTRRSYSSDIFPYCWLSVAFPLAVQSLRVIKSIRSSALRFYCLRTAQDFTYPDWDFSSWAARHPHSYYNPSQHFRKVFVFIYLFI